MRKAGWRAFPPRVVTEDSTDLMPLYIGWESPRGTVLTLSEIWVCSNAVQMRWHGARKGLYTCITGTWVTCFPDPYERLLEAGYAPLTQGMLCADNCAPLMEILYHDHERLLADLDRF